MLLGTRVRNLRLANGFTQAQLANLLNLKSASTITMWEKGDRTPGSSMLIKLTRIFHCSTDYLLGLEEGKEVEESNSFNETSP